MRPELPVHRKHVSAPIYEYLDYPRLTWLMCLNRSEPFRIRVVSRGARESRVHIAYKVHASVPACHDHKHVLKLLRSVQAVSVQIIHTYDIRSYQDLQKVCKPRSSCGLALIDHSTLLDGIHAFLDDEKQTDIVIVVLMHDLAVPSTSIRKHSRMRSPRDLPVAQQVRDDLRHLCGLLYGACVSYKDALAVHNRVTCVEYATRRETCRCR